MAIFCNNKLCQFEDCDRHYNGEELLDTDYVGDFSSSCKRIAKYTADIINNGTWRQVFKERYGSHEDS